MEYGSRPVRPRRGVRHDGRLDPPGGETVPRYYHIYSPAEFEIDLGESALSVVDVDISSGNCYATVTASDA